VAIDPASWIPRYGDSLWRFALSRLRDPQAAEDVIQDALAAALAAKDRFEGQSSELTWLTGILNHKIMDHFRRQGRRPTVGLDALGEDGPAGEFDAKGHRNRMPGPLAGEASGRVDPQLLEDLADCKDGLPPSLAEPFELREVRGMDGPTVCQVLGFTPTNLWTRLHRARAALRKCLEDKQGARAPHDR
jgi:RNA polymerase sigma-70 factor (TIGR02943 family)